MATALKLKPKAVGKREAELEAIIGSVCRLAKVSREEWREQSSQKIVPYKMAAVVFLSEKLPQREWGLIEDLVVCSRSFITKALASAEQTTSEGVELKRLLGHFRPQTAMLASPPTIKQDDLPIEDRLRDISKTIFKVDDSMDANERRKAERFGRLAVMYIARWSLGKTLHDAADIAAVALSTAEPSHRQAREEYLAQDTFYKKVGLICAKLKLEVP